MRKISRWLFVPGFLVLIATAVSAQSQTKLPVNNNYRIGEYNYASAEPETAGGSVLVIEYRIVVSVKGDSLVARFTADGYQSNADYSCSAKAVGNRLDPYFLKDLSDTGMQQINSRLRKGRLTGSLLETTVRGRARYLFKNKINFNPKQLPVFKKS